MAAAHRGRRRPRSRAGAEAAILRALSRYGFTWDGPVVRQSARTALYQRALDRLVAQRDVYPCACTRRELLAALRQAAERIYPGTCRAGVPAGRGARTRLAWRAIVDNATICFIDRLQGPGRQALARDVGDFLIKRSDGLFAYQLAVVVDDAEQRVTDVVRGADLLELDAAPDPLAAFARRDDTVLPSPAGRDQRGRREAFQANARAALPDDPLEPLLAAWRFLEQPAPRTPLRRHRVLDTRSPTGRRRGRPYRCSPHRRATPAEPANVATGV